MSHTERETPAARKDDSRRGGKNNRREIFGWMMYDWANSAFSTTVAGVIRSMGNSSD